MRPTRTVATLFILVLVFGLGWMAVDVMRPPPLEPVAPVVLDAEPERGRAEERERRRRDRPASGGGAIPAPPPAPPPAGEDDDDAGGDDSDDGGGSD